MTEENKEYIDAYIFMTYENMLKVFENNCLKIIFPEECNDPFEFLFQNSPCYSNKIDGLRYSYGFLSFTGKYTSPPMWGHYADKHKGCCVHFRFPSLPEQETTDRLGKNHKYKYRKLLFEPKGDCLTIDLLRSRNKEAKETKNTILWNVIYSTERVKYNGLMYDSFKDNEKRLSRIINKAFLVKDISWQYEDEKRIIIPTTNPQKVKNNMVFTEDFNKYISSVILGMKCPASVGLTLSLINYHNKGGKIIRVHKAEPTDTTFEIISHEHEAFLKELKNSGE